MQLPWPPEYEDVRQAGSVIMGKPPYQLRRLTVWQSACSQVIECQGVAVNVFSFPHIPCGAYVLTVDKITLVIE
jgi:hypothetical protein